MYSIEKLIKYMEKQFVVNDEDDLVFKEKFKDIVKHSDLVNDCKNRFYVEYEEVNIYYTVGQFNIGIIDHNNNKLKAYEILLQYTHDELDGFDIPTNPTLIIKECYSNDIVGTYI